MPTWGDGEGGGGAQDDHHPPPHREHQHDHHHHRRPNRFLVFSSVGNKCLQAVRDNWLRHPEQAIFDVVLVFYAATARNEVFKTLQSMQRSRERRSPGEGGARKGYKWPNFKWWLESKGKHAFQSSSSSSS
eukprot:CAMPEP_0167800846 /NCGR_PEP_ID=MMETSP0111_2-20121227/18030_1 /TAXON_ID=91324 /ORGANISM="Lotharella globosa, Strain CCCM811" /LENGTH=130 /DNA_ID=CAMNT_0007696295 /DNA_START=27 /DNA_END=416 /DNA_ORIENTATION=-